MKKIIRIVSILLVVVLATNCLSSSAFAAEASDSKNDYINRVLSHYLAVEGNKYGKVELSQAYTIYDHINDSAEIYFVMNDGIYVGLLTLAMEDGQYVSSFMFDDTNDISDAISAGIPMAAVCCSNRFEIVTSTGGILLASDSCEEDLLETHSISELTVSYQEPSISEVDIEPFVPRVSRADPFVSLPVPIVGNGTGAGAGLCWAASISAISNYKLGTNYTAKGLFDALYNAYTPDVPVGLQPWYDRGFRWCGMNSEFINGKLSFTSMYSKLKNFNPIILTVGRPNQEASGGKTWHDVVLRYMEGGNEGATLGFMDCNWSKYIYVLWDDPSLSPDKFVYTTPDYQYPAWRSCVYPT